MESTSDAKSRERERERERERVCIFLVFITLLFDTQGSVKKTPRGLEVYTVTPLVSVWSLYGQSNTSDKNDWLNAEKWWLHVHEVDIPMQLICYIDYWAEDKSLL